jgi:hypothetical protein
MEEKDKKLLIKMLPELHKKLDRIVKKVEELYIKLIKIKMEQ